MTVHRELAVGTWRATMFNVALLVAAGPAATGCFVEADLPQVRVTREALQFPGTLNLAPTPDGVDPSAVPDGLDQADLPEGFTETEQGAQVADAIDSGALEGGLLEMTESFEQDKELEFPDGLDSSLWPVRASLIAREGTEDLSFLQAFEVTVRCVDGELPPSRLFAYSGTSEGVMTTLVATSDERPNVVDYWACQQAFYDVHVTGSLPEEDWQVDVAIELQGNFKVSF